MFGIDDAILGATVGGVTGLASTWWTNEKAAERQSDAQGFSAQQYATRYQTQVRDLQAAGLNPMLAYAQSPGSSPTGVAAPVQNPADSMTKLTGALLQAVINSAQTANIQADTENKKATQGLIAAQTGLANSSAMQSRAATDNLDAQSSKIGYEIANLQIEQDRLIVAVQKTLAEIQQIKAETMTEAQKKEYTKALVAKVVSETNLNELDIKAAEKFDNFGREAKQYAPLLELFKFFIRQRSR